MAKGTQHTWARIIARPIILMHSGDSTTPQNLFKVETVGPASEMLTWGSRWWRDALKRSRHEPRTLGWDGHPLEAEEQGMGFPPEPPQTSTHEPMKPILNFCPPELSNSQDFKLLNSWQLLVAATVNQNDHCLIADVHACVCFFFFFWPNGIMKSWWFCAVWKLLESIPSIATLKNIFIYSWKISYMCTIYFDNIHLLLPIRMHPKFPLPAP